MKKAWYRLTAFLLAAIMLLSFVGCDTNEPDTDGNDTDLEETTSAPETTCEEHTYVKTAEYEAMALRSGVRCFTCSTCGHYYEEMLPKTKSIKVLAIGNSFSKNTMEYLTDICKDAGIETIVLGNLYIGGCTLDKHWTNISGNAEAYEYFKNTSGSMKSVSKAKSVQAALADEEWDVVTVQQGSSVSGVASSYDPYLNNILSFLEENKPTEHTKIIWHMTWAYQSNSTHASFPTYNKDQLTMYQKIVECVESKINTDSRIAGVIPAGTAIQNLRTSYVGDTVTQDGYHLNGSHGKYVGALTWYAYLTGGSINAVTWVPSAYQQVLTADLAVMREAVSNALSKPLEITQSTKTEMTDAEQLQRLGLNITNYQLLDWQPKIGKYYYSTQSFNQFSSSSKYTASALLTKAELPVGSVIIVDEGYEYRPEAWTTEAKLTTSRPGKVSKNVTLVNDAWWGSYKYRAFNLSYTGASTTMTAADRAHLRIYVPKTN